MFIYCPGKDTLREAQSTARRAGSRVETPSTTREAELGVMGGIEYDGWSVPSVLLDVLHEFSMIKTIHRQKYVDEKSLSYSYLES